LQRGIRVLPETPLQGSDLSGAIVQALREATLSVHMLGQFYGKKIIGERSLAQVQCDLAGARAQEDTELKNLGPAFTRIIWTPRDLPRTNIPPAQQNFLQTLENTLDSHTPTEMLRVGIEELKDRILAKVFPPPPAPPDVDDPVVCVAYAPEDEAPGRTIQNYLSDQQELTVFFASSADEEALRRRLHRYMQQCDALLIFYGQAPLDWVEDTALKARTLTKGRTKRPLMCIYDGLPDKKEELGIQFSNLLIIKHRQQFQA